MAVLPGWRAAVWGCGRRPRWPMLRARAGDGDQVTASGRAQVKEPGKLWRAAGQGETGCRRGEGHGEGGAGLEASFGTKVRPRGARAAWPGCAAPSRRGPRGLNRGQQPLRRRVTLAHDQRDARPRWPTADVLSTRPRDPLPSDAGRGITVKPGAHVELRSERARPSATVTAVGVTTSTPAVSLWRRER
ncbi:hypothetical protein [Nonomuraea dietziae]|uniref:hypothetical protein n=1 Tax=Nonomuraea dietziae TaxID=65515 RepID=UPI0031E3E739